ncbi:hypothetical protein BDF19DRAFT_421330 [Syncephalis fuscata]|nr:hypothetical protein BDF19DRAFT_421330 [Syncephalis fuscata]
MDAKRARSNIFQPTRSSPLTQSTPTTSSDISQSRQEAYYCSLRGLNISIHEHIAQTIEHNPFADLSIFQNEYNNHLQEIQTKYRDVTQHEKESMENESATISPKLATTTSLTSFIDKKDSTEGKKSFEKSIKPLSESTIATATTFGSSTSVSASSNESFSTFKVAPFNPPAVLESTKSTNDDTTSSQLFSTIKVPSFNPPSMFGATKSTSSDTSVTKGSPKDADTTVKPVFSFGETTSNTIAKSPFSFGSTSTSPNTSGGSLLSFNSKPAIEQKSSDSTTKNEDENGTNANGGGEDNDADDDTASTSLPQHQQDFVEKGLGELRLNQEKEDTARSRIICRIEGTGGLLLNVRIYKGMPLDIIGKSKKDIQTLVSIDGKMTRILLRVKDANIATAFKEQLEKMIANC